MKKTLQECKEIVAKEQYEMSFDLILTLITKSKVIKLTDLANKMYYEQSEWIDKNIQVPDNSRDVMLADLESDIVSIGFYVDFDKRFYPVNIMNVTHWQTLPNPPQK